MEFYENRLRENWIGSQTFSHDAVDIIDRTGAFKNLNRNLLFSYLSERAHPDGTQLNYLLDLTPPPVDIIAAAFRPTRSGKEEKDKLNPFWSAMQSVLSAMKAAELQSYGTNVSYISSRHSTESLSEQVLQTAYSYDNELARRVLFHPVVFCRARLFSIDDDLSEVNSARIYIKNIDFSSRYIDLVNFNFAGDYIKNTLKHFERNSHRAIQETWDRFESLGWKPGQSAHSLARALGTEGHHRTQGTPSRRKSSGPEEP